MNDVGLLFSRVALGASIAAHGAQKAFGSFGGPGPQGAAQFLESLGFVPGARFATAAAWTEMLGGTLIAFGVGGATGPAAVVSTMVVAQTTVHAKNGFFAQNGGVELGVIYCAGAVALASAGYGRFSLDEALGWQSLRASWLTSLALAGGIVAGCLVLTQRVGPDVPVTLNDASDKPAAIGESSADSLATAADHIAAAHDDRPVPADLLSASSNDAGS